MDTPGHLKLVNNRVKRDTSYCSMQYLYVTLALVTWSRLRRIAFEWTWKLRFASLKHTISTEAFRRKASPFYATS